MKVGIISMQRVPNYGSFLQAYGLKKTLESMGHEVQFIDYKPGNPVVPYSKKSKVIYMMKRLPLIAWLNDSFKYHVLKKRAFVYRYNLKYLKKLGINYHFHYNTKVDVAIIGSDEVFNCLQAGPNVGFSPMLFGKNINAKKVISYAASFGYTNAEGIKKYGIAKKLRRYFEDFSAISVRDENSRRLIKKLTGKEPNVNLDPVLISDYEVPQTSLKYKDYVVLYTYKTRKYSEEEKKQIIDFCEKEGKKLVSIGNAQKWIPNIVDVDPLTLLAYIKGADFIITDTFHGSVFSIKYNKKFVTYIRDDNRNKLMDLLVRLKRDDRKIDDFTQLESFYHKEIDYSDTNAIIQEERSKTREYLKSQIR